MEGRTLGAATAPAVVARLGGSLLRRLRGLVEISLDSLFAAEHGILGSANASGGPLSRSYTASGCGYGPVSGNRVGAAALALPRGQPADPSRPASRLR